MSQFLPETGIGETKPVGGQVSDSDIQFVSRAFGNPNLIAQVAPQFLSYLVSYIEQSGLLIPVSQVPGFSAFTAKYASVGSSEAITGSSYGDLSTVGPQITGLPPGSYLLLYGAYLEGQPSSNTVAFCSPSVNGSTPSDSNAAIQQALYQVSVASASLATLSLDANTVKLQYKRTTSGPYNPSATYRWLIAFKYANL